MPGQWGDARADFAPAVRSTGVVLDAGMARAGLADAIGRGATLAQTCTSCHGVRGLGEGSAPNLAGQWAEVIVKQLTDYQQGDRQSAVMQALARHLSKRDIADVAAFYADLPPAREGDGGRSESVPRLVSVGAPMRNIAPCASCHGAQGRKLGAPWLEAMPKSYLTAQLVNFASGLRANDSHAQMRNMARSLSAAEVDELSSHYARSPAPAPPTPQ